jgi:hypothetical protein
MESTTGTTMTAFARSALSPSAVGVFPSRIDGYNVRVRVPEGWTTVYRTRDLEDAKLRASRMAARHGATFLGEL